MHMYVIIYSFSSLTRSSQKLNSDTNAEKCVSFPPDCRTENTVLIVNGLFINGDN